LLLDAVGFPHYAALDHDQMSDELSGRPSAPGRTRFPLISRDGIGAAQQAPLSVSQLLEDEVEFRHAAASSSFRCCYLFDSDEILVQLCVLCAANFVPSVLIPCLSLTLSCQPSISSPLRRSRRQPVQRHTPAAKPEPRQKPVRRSATRPEASRKSSRRARRFPALPPMIP